MTDSFVTQCPHCQTSFRVNHHQLSVARGVVRCGQCLQVFNAARQLLEQSQAASGQPPLSPPPAIEPTAPLVPVAEPVVARAPLRQDDWASTAQALDELDLDQELERLERRGKPQAQQPGAAGDALQAHRDDLGADAHGDEPFGTANDDHPADVDLEDEPAPMLVEQAPHDPEPLPEARTEPTLDQALDLEDDDLPPRSGAPAQRDEPLHDRLAQDDETVPERGLSALDDEPPALRVSARDEHDEQDSPRTGERLEPVLAAKAPRARKEPLVDVVDDPLQLGWEKPAPNWGKRLLWGFLTLLAAGLLAFQYIWFHFDEMARHDRYRPLFQQICPMLGCKVPTRVDIGRIKSSNLVVRSHPDFKGALIVDAIIYNRAPFSQPFPLLELRFADLNGQLIASRRFKPSEYLSGELAGRGDMPSQTPIHIALDILDPGPKAVNYSLSFRSPE